MFFLLFWNRWNEIPVTVYYRGYLDDWLWQDKTEVRQGESCLIVQFSMVSAFILCDQSWLGITEQNKFLLRKCQFHHVASIMEMSPLRKLLAFQLLRRAGFQCLCPQYQCTMQTASQVWLWDNIGLGWTPGAHLAQDAWPILVLKKDSSHVTAPTGNVSF